MRQNFTSGQAVKESLAAEYSTLHPCLSRRVQSHRSSPWSNSTTNYYYGNLVVLDKVLWLAGNSGVGVHHILVHHCLGSEQGETSGAGGWRVQLKRERLREFYLQRTQPSMCSVAFWSQCPMAYSNFWYLKNDVACETVSTYIVAGLVPLHVAASRGMDSSTSSSHIGVPFHQVDHLPMVSRRKATLTHLDNGLRLEVDVSIEGEQKGVFRSHLYISSANHFLWLTSFWASVNEGLSISWWPRK